MSFIGLFCTVLWLSCLNCLFETEILHFENRESKLENVNDDNVDLKMVKKICTIMQKGNLHNCNLVYCITKLTL